ncbi:MAG: chemotaxis protein CheA [Gammaproteobacteria bacterium]|nr:MAG: chemotaxis protein CheA [Gammaproteobacteria bacterium]
MSFGADEELLEDFLVEAGEILEQLSEQLVELENTPDDQELLNAIFRGFHTIKGGAGFLNLGALVEVSHRTENVFDLLRNHQRSITAKLMDVILQSVDTVNDMFDTIKEGSQPEKADSQLLADLDSYSKPESEDPVAAEEVVEDASKAAASSDSDEISDDDFEALLDQLHGSGGAPSGSKEEDTPKAEAEKTTEQDSGEMSEDDFEALLDQLHGDGKSPGGDSPTPTPTPEPKKVEPAKKSKPAAKKTKVVTESTIRVSTKRLDDIMNIVGELVLVRNRMSILTQNSHDEPLSETAQNLDLVTGQLQAAVMKTRMQPIKKVFGRFPRVVRDLARNLKKEIELVLEGEDTDLDKNLVEALSDPLVHLVRNSVDHGIELPEKRAKMGKKPCGKITLSAVQRGDHILLSIIDDGAGMDADVLRGIAVKKGLMTTEAAARLTDGECYNLIFQAGFSTKTEISDVSGRGVGMDVVKTKIAQLSGALDIDSEIGVGTTISIKVPLTLAIMPTLMVIVGEQRFALPLASVNEIINLDLSKANTVDGQLVIIVREKALPLFYLEHWLVKGADTSKRKKTGHVVIYQAGAKKVGFVVDALVGQEEVVIKPLGKCILGTPGMSGATITSDGGIALIIDVPNLLAHYSGQG